MEGTPEIKHPFEREDIVALREMFRRAYGKDFEDIWDTGLPGLRDTTTGSDGYLRTLLNRLYHRELMPGNLPPFPTTLEELANILANSLTAENDTGQQGLAVAAMLADPEDLPRYAGNFFEAEDMDLEKSLLMLDNGMMADPTRLSGDAAVIALWRLQCGL